MSIDPAIAELFGAPGVTESNEVAHVAELGRRYVELRAAKDEAESGLSKLNQQLAGLEESLLAKLDEHKLKSIRLESGQLLTATLKTDYRLPPAESLDARKRVFAWIQRCKGGSLIEKTIHWARLASWCCERRDAGKDISADIVQNERRGITMRKS